MSQGIIFSVISFDVPQCGLDDSQKDFNGYVGSNVEDLGARHGNFSYGVRNNESDRFLEFCTAMNMAVSDTLFKKASYQVTYEFGPSKIQTKASF